MAEIIASFVAPGTGIVLIFNFYETDGSTTMDVSGADSYNVYTKGPDGTETTLTAAAGDEVYQVKYTVGATDFTAGQWTLHAEPVNLGGITESSSPVVRLYVKDRHED